MDYAALLDRLSRLDACADSDALDCLGVAGVVDVLTRRSTTDKIVRRVQTMKLTAGAPPDGSKTHLGIKSIDQAESNNVIVIEQETGIDAAESEICKQLETGSRLDAVREKSGCHRLQTPDGNTNL